jgi:ElaB/YqjD/DUF883 family membrane-anchored ribosome-binding protein
MPDFLEKQATIEDILREFSRFKSSITDAVDQGVRAAMHAVKQGRDAADDAIYHSRRAVKQNPLQSMGIIFAAGVTTGAIAGAIAAAIASWISAQRD